VSLIRSAIRNNPGNTNISYMKIYEKDIFIEDYNKGKRQQENRTVCSVRVK